MNYIITTAKGELFALATPDLDAALDPKEGLIGRRFLTCKTLLGLPAYLHVDAIESIQPTTAGAGVPNEKSPF